jgi:hypothetical protein
MEKKILFGIWMTYRQEALGRLAMPARDKARRPA